VPLDAGFEKGEEIEDLVDIEPREESLRRTGLRKAIIEFMRQDTRCRNDDRWLMWRVWKDFDKISVYIPYEDMKKLSLPGSVVRIRAMIQNDEKKFLPTRPEIRDARRISEEQWREWLIKAKNIFGLKW